MKGDKKVTFAHPELSFRDCYFSSLYHSGYFEVLTAAAALLLEVEVIILQKKDQVGVKSPRPQCDMDTHERRVMLAYPPGKIYQRGEERSQGNVENSTATSMREPLDMAYASAICKTSFTAQVKFVDYYLEGIFVF